MAGTLHISLSAEKVAQLGPLVISNSILTSLIVSAIIIGLAFYIKSQIRPSNQKPSGIQNIAELFIENLYNLIHGVTGTHQKTRQFFPLIATFFFFIWFNNELGLLPGIGTIGFTEEAGAEHAVLLESNVALESSKAYAATETNTHAEAEVAATDTHAATPASADDHAVETSGEVHAENPTGAAHAEAEGGHTKFVPYLRAGTADLNTTLALAIIWFFATQFFGIKYLSLGYFKKFFNFSSPIMFFVGILELVSEFGKIISFAFRLFGNVFAGEVLLAVIGFLVALVVPMPFYGLEIFVGFVQALVFALLATVFFNMATLSHDEH